MHHLPLMEDRRTVVAEERNGEEGEIEEAKKETPNGKNVLFKLEGFQKQ